MIGLQNIVYNIQKAPIVKNITNLEILLTYHKTVDRAYHDFMQISPKTTEKTSKVIGIIEKLYHMYVQVIDRTPTLHNDLDFNLVMATAQNIDAYWKQNSWEKLLADLVFVINLKQKIEEYKKIENGKLSELDKNQEQFLKGLKFDPV